jgi:hypothetical protein
MTTTTPRRQPRRLRRGLVAIGLVVGLIAGTACTDDGDGDATTPPSTAVTVPSSTGDRCTDDSGDLDLPVGVDPSNTVPFNGIDLVDVAGEVQGDDLVLSFTTAGPIEYVPSPTFVVAQGEPLQALSFELRVIRGDDGGWDGILVTWPSSREEREPIALDVQVDGTTLTTSLPLDRLPPIARTLQFGAASESQDGLVVIDDCNNLTQG